MSMISDNANRAEGKIRRAASLVLAVVIVFCLSGCGADNGEEAPDAQSQCQSVTPSITEGTPSAGITDAPVIEPSAAGTPKGTPEADASGLPLDEPAYTLTPTPDSTPGVSPTEQPLSEPADEYLVKVLDYIPSTYVELKYASEDNFTGKVIYDFSDAYLRYGTVKKLMDVQTELTEEGYSLKIWDAYRPVSAQFTLWETCPNPIYVANPNKGYSSHSKGNTVDVTLVKSDGTELTMPTGFDDFSALADRDYSDVSIEAATNALILENTMSAHGFNCYSGEWWHFSDSTAYSVIEG